MFRKFFILAVAMLVLAMVPAAFANPVPGTASSNAVIQNLSSDSATLVVTYYEPTGNVAYTNDDVTVPGESVREIKTADEPLPAGFAGSAVVSSDREIAAIVSIRYTNVPGDSDGKSQGAYNGFSAGANDIFFPSLWDFNGIVSQFTVMNTESTAATVDLTYYSRSGAVVATDQVTIPGYAGMTFDLADNSQTPSNFGDDGSVTASSSNALAGASTAIYANRAAAYQALAADDRGTTLYASSQFRFKANPSNSFYNLFSAINIQNTSATTAADVTVEYYNRATGALDLSVDISIPAGSARGLNTRNGGDLPESTFNALGTDFSGSVKIISNNDIELVGTNVTQWGAGVKRSAISALSSQNGAADTIYLPAQYRLLSGGNWSQWTSVNIQNVGDTTIAASDLSVKYVDTSGNVLATFSGSSLPSNIASGLEAGAAIGMNTRTGGDLSPSAFNSFGNGFIGGVIVEGPEGSELIATANVVYKDRGSSYNGFGR